MAAALASVIVLAVAFGSVGAADAAPAPSAAPPVTVVIPDLSPTPSASPSPSASPGGTTGTGGSTGGGSTGGTGTDTGTGTDGGTGTPAAPARNPDGSPVAASAPTVGAKPLPLETTTVLADGFLEVSVGGYAPGENVQFVLYSSPVVLLSESADDGGTVAARLQIPKSTRPGVHTIEATGWNSNYVTNSTVIVVSTTDQSAFAGVPWLWWVLFVILGILLAILILAFWFRRNINAWFSARPTPEAVS